MWRGSALTNAYIKRHIPIRVEYTTDEAKMKLELLRQPDDLRFLHYTAESLLRTWLWYNGIHVSDNKYGDRILELNYNSFYHFYDIVMFPNREGNEPTRYWQEVIELFRKDGYKMEVMSTFKWLNPQTPEHKMIDGVRIWIYPKELNK